jgi:hypothetical protein
MAAVPILPGWFSSRKQLNTSNYPGIASWKLLIANPAS